METELPAWLTPSTVPLNPRRRRRGMSVVNLTDFRIGIDEVRRHEGRVYIVDRHGEYAAVEVEPDEITKFPAFQVEVSTSTDIGALMRSFFMVSRCATLSNEGRLERVGCILERLRDLASGRPSFEIVLSGPAQL